MLTGEQRRLAKAHPDLRRAVEAILAHVNAPGKLPAGVRLGVHTVWRSPEAQLAAYRSGNSRLKRGKHNLSPARAADLVFLVGGRWSWDRKLPWWLVGYWAEAAGVNWGGRWGTPQAARKAPAHAGMALGWDCPHVELSGWG